MKFPSLVKSVSQNINKARRAARLTQEALAESAGMNYKFYQRVEEGRSNPTLKTLWRIATVLKVKPGVFFR